MKKKLRKSITIFLCMALLTLFVPQTTVNAYEPGDIFRAGDFDYAINEDGKTVEVDFYRGAGNLESLVIPSSVTAPDGTSYAVTKMGKGFLGTIVSTVKSLHIPQGIAEIETNSCWNAENLNTLTFDPDMTSLTTIGPRAFQYVPFDTSSVRLPYGVTTIGDEAFKRAKPKEFILPDTLTYLDNPSTFLEQQLSEVWLEVRKDVEIIGPELGFHVATKDPAGDTLKITGVELHHGGKVTNHGSIALPVRLPEGNEITVAPGQSYIAHPKADVKIDYIPRLDGGEITRVDITWGALEFSYHEGGPGVWNTQTHNYDGAAEQGWTVDTEGGDLIKLDNHSNIGLDVEFVYNSKTGYETIAGTLSGDGITEGKATLPTAENTLPESPPTVTAKLTFSGNVPVNMPDTQTVIGTVTVKIGGGNQ